MVAKCSFNINANYFENFSYEVTFWELTGASPLLETNIIKINI